MSANPVLLDRAAIISALLMGLLVWHFGFPAFLPLMLVFLVASTAVTKYGHGKKREMGLYEHERSWENVLANGTIPVLCAVFSPGLGWGAYVGSLAAITADKFASELGVLGPEPRSLLTLRAAKRGESGCVSTLGLLMSLDGGLLIGLAALLLMPSSMTPWKMILVGLIGFSGSMADSAAGVLEERGIGTKGTTNLICSAVGAILGWAFLA